MHYNPKFIIIHQREEFNDAVKLIKKIIMPREQE